MVRPTVYDVATLAGVSIATVSFTFTKPDKVRPATRDRVLAAAAEIGYVPSGNARGLARGRTGAVGLYAFDYLLDPGVDDESRVFPLYADEVQRGVELECRDAGYALMLGAGRLGEDDSNSVIDVAGRVDGLITFANIASAAALDQIALRIPVVELGAGPIAGRHSTVRVDNLGGMRTLVSHLLVVHGYRTFAYIGPPSTSELTDRHEGFVGILAEAGLTAPPAWRSRLPSGDADAPVANAISTRSFPDVLVCATDQEALTMMDLLREAGVRVPEDVAVTGFDGVLAGRLSDPPLTTVRQPMQEIGRRAVRTILTAVATNAESTPGAVLPVDLLIRRSCGCPAP